MRRRLLRVLAAGVLAVAIATAGGTVPAHAAGQPSQQSTQQVQPMAADPTVWVDLAIKAYSAFNGGGGIDQNALNAAVQEIKAAIASARNDILNHIDAALVVFANTCVQGFDARAENIDKYSGVTLEQQANASVDCAIFVSNTLRTVQDKRLADHVGQLVGPMYAMAAGLNGRAGFTINGLLGNYARVSLDMTSKLAPACRDGVDWSDPDHNIGMYLTYGCTGADGTSVGAVQWVSDVDGTTPLTGWLYRDPGTNTYVEVSRQWVHDTSGQNSSWAEAVAALPRLRALGF